MTAPTIDLDAVRTRAEHVNDYIQKDPCADGWAPLSVRELFRSDIPALLAEVTRLRALTGPVKRGTCTDPDTEEEAQMKRRLDI